MTLAAPFPYFGGKRRAAPLVWGALGDPSGYVEPFAGSAAVLLARPAFTGRRVETINDADGWLVNTWRAIALHPGDVARHATGPVTEIDYHARLAWLQERRTADLVSWLEGDPEACDAKAAGWWLYVTACGIGDPWGRGPWRVVDGRLRKLPHLGDPGRGVNRKLPHLGDAGRAGYNAMEYRPNVLGYFEELAGRLRDVRVCCGDWSRVVTNGALSFGSTVGVFLDPPYLGDVRTADLYAVDDHTISHEVRDWCLANGDDPRYRIVLAGYSDEHDALIPDTWRRHRYSASAAYSTTASAARQDGNHANRKSEVLWMSPHCLTPDQGTLWETL